MKATKRNVLFLLMVVGIATAVAAQRTLRVAAPRKEASPAAAVRKGGPPPGELGARVPEFSVTDIHGRTLTAGDLRGKVLLVDYWATWCSPCEKEMPGYQRLAEKYRDRGLLVIGIAFDGDMKMGNESVEHYAKRLRIHYPLVLDTPELQEHFGGIQGLPTTFVLDRHGIIRFKIVGFESTGKIEAALKKLL